MVVDEWEVPSGEDGSMAAAFALVIAGVAVGLREPQELERLFFELALSLTEDGVLISFFPSEAEVEQKEVPFYTNRNIEQIVSRLLTVERIATMMDGTRRIVARKHE